MTYGVGIHLVYRLLFSNWLWSLKAVVLMSFLFSGLLMLAGRYRFSHSSQNKTCKQVKSKKKRRTKSSGNPNVMLLDDEDVHAKVNSCIAEAMSEIAPVSCSSYEEHPSEHKDEEYNVLEQRVPGCSDQISDSSLSSPPALEEFDDSVFAPFTAITPTRAARKKKYQRKRSKLRKRKDMPFSTQGSRTTVTDRHEVEGQESNSKAIDNECLDNSMDISYREITTTIDVTTSECKSCIEKDNTTEDDVTYVMNATLHEESTSVISKLVSITEETSSSTDNDDDAIQSYFQKDMSTDTRDYVDDESFTEENQEEINLEQELETKRDNLSEIRRSSNQEDFYRKEKENNASSPEGVAMISEECGNINELSVDNQKDELAPHASYHSCLGDILLTNSSSIDRSTDEETMSFEEDRHDKGYSPISSSPKSSQSSSASYGKSEEILVRLMASCDVPSNYVFRVCCSLDRTWDSKLAMSMLPVRKPGAPVVRGVWNWKAQFSIPRKFSGFGFRYLLQSRTFIEGQDAVIWEDNNSRIVDFSKDLSHKVVIASSKPLEFPLPSSSNMENNENIFRSFGPTPAEAAGKCVESIVHEPDEQRDWKSIVISNTCSKFNEKDIEEFVHIWSQQSSLQQTKFQQDKRRHSEGNVDYLSKNSSFQTTNHLHNKDKTQNGVLSCDYYCGVRRRNTVYSQNHPQKFLDEKHYMVLKQIEYYLSEENLCRDLFVRNRMDSHGYIYVSVLANFNRVRYIGAGLSLPDIVRTLDTSSHLTIFANRNANGEICEEWAHLAKVRVRKDWKRWLTTSLPLQPIACRVVME